MPQSKKEKRLRKCAATSASTSVSTSPYFSASTDSRFHASCELSRDSDTATTSDEGDWEKVPELENDNGGLETGGVEVLVSRSNKLVRLGDAQLTQERRRQRELADDLHRVHLLCLIARCLRASKVADNCLLAAVCMSQIPSPLIDELSDSKASVAPSLDWLRSLLTWFRGYFSLNIADYGRRCLLLRDQPTLNCAMRCAAARGSNSVEVLAVLMTCCLRSLGIGRSRFVASPSVLPRTAQQPATASSSAVTAETQVEFWCEVPVVDFSGTPGIRWVSVDVARGLLDRPDLIGSHLSQSRTAPALIGYAFGIDGSGRLRDVTWRYVTDYRWLLPDTARKLRAPAAWISNSLRAASSSPDAETSCEDADDADKESESLRASLMRLPPPVRHADFKGHPLFAVKRHLLKYEVLRPEAPEPAGFLQPSGEPFYTRDCVHLCHTRETWLKAARVVRPGELAAKVVRARLSAKRRLLASDPEAAFPTVELFGRWQTEAFQPPRAADGLVPRNEHGNVELFQPSMLPLGCVYLRAPGIGQVAKRLGVDAAPAMTGWEFHAGGWAHPLLDGWVVCAGRDCHGRLVAAWLSQRREERAAAAARTAARAWANWDRLCRGMLERDRIRRKYLGTV